MNKMLELLNDSIFGQSQIAIEAHLLLDPIARNEDYRAISELMAIGTEYNMISRTIDGRYVIAAAGLAALKNWRRHGPNAFA